MNFNSTNHSYEINRNVLNDINYNPDVNILGIARGERNLVYATVINQKGEVLFEKSFNIIDNGIKCINYHQKLDNIEKARENSKKSWKEIDNIKDLKQGYLSIVIKEITDLMFKYNAIVALEDLSSDFKNSRVHIEKQIYQNFEKMLVNKLNFYVDKNCSGDTYGSVRKAYQLAPKFDSFKQLGIQSGFVFYVPTAYTSSIDPTTGFASLFTSKHLSYNNFKDSQNFVKSFNEICYDHELKCFKFDFNYSNFNTRPDYTDSWQVYSYGSDRAVYYKEDNILKCKSFDITKEFKNLFNEYGIAYDKGNLIDSISEIRSKDFYVKFLWLFKSLVQLKYSDGHRNYILSPVQKDGRFFDSRAAGSNEPKDVDANGAYHIALQGLRIIKHRIKDGKLIFDEKGRQAYNWLEFVQKKEFNK